MSEQVMHASDGYRVDPIGFVRSDLKDPADAPKQGSEGAPAATIDLRPEFRDALEGVALGDRLVVLTWLHLADHTTLKVHPRADPGQPSTGVFATRSQGRPNPVGLHDVVVEHVEGLTLRVSPMEAVDGTPVVDVKVGL